MVSKKEELKNIQTILGEFKDKLDFIVKEVSDSRKKDQHIWQRAMTRTEIRFKNKIEQIKLQNLKIEKYANKEWSNAAKTVKVIKNKLDAFDESLMMVIHNIKKSQFLYAHYPDEWVKNYLDVKNGMKKENEYLDKKIEETS